MPTALISVWEKRRVVDLGRRLAAAGFEILSTGGTARELRDAGIDVTEVSDVTRFPEILDGRVKTLHPAIHAGLLARRDLSSHMTTIEEHGLRTIDVLVSNLYPFADAVRRENTPDEFIIENIDIGGPAMVRAAAKNHAAVIVLTDPADYDDILTAVENGGVDSIVLARRRELAAKAFQHVATYDALVASYLATGESLPEHLPIGARKLHDVRYGENPHQRAAVYAVPQTGPSAGVASWNIHDGREMSYNNYLDASAAWQCVETFDTPAVVIVKHTLPCGVGTSADLVEAYERALSGDPVSAFGGIMACNRVVTDAVTQAIGRHRFDVMIAPGYDDAALERLLKKRNLRLISVGNPEPVPGWEVRSIPGGLLVQEPDVVGIDPTRWKCVTSKQPTPEQIETLAFAWKAARFVKSNAIVLAQPGTVVGVGAGQPNRVESVRIAVKVAGDRASGSCLASDAFFPFPDGVEEAARAGVAAIAQPGGSVRDDETIAVAEAYGMVMMLTGMRNFRH
jgi:phosphoribosylaminoimidazolecarboxamide formyltransferase / IMP cyclohydrolase